MPTCRPPQLNSHKAICNCRPHFRCRQPCPARHSSTTWDNSTEQMRHEAAGIAGDGGLGFANAHPAGAVAFLMAAYRSAADGIHAIEGFQWGVLLPHEAFLAVIAGSLEIASRLVERDICAF